MNWIKNLFETKQEVQNIKDNIVEYSNGVRINFSLLGRVIAAKRERNEITHFPNIFTVKLEYKKEN